jgi:hypothetical protein
MFYSQLVFGLELPSKGGPEVLGSRDSRESVSNATFNIIYVFGRWNLGTYSIPASLVAYHQLKQKNK